MARANNGQLNSCGSSVVLREYTCIYCYVHSTRINRVHTFALCKYDLSRRYKNVTKRKRYIRYTRPRGFAFLDSEYGETSIAFSRYFSRYTMFCFNSKYISHDYSHSRVMCKTTDSRGGFYGAIKDHDFPKTFRGLI